MQKAYGFYYLMGLAFQIKMKQNIMYKYGFERGFTDEQTLKMSQQIDDLVNQFVKTYHFLKYS